jgi:hypothetical protein
MKKAKISFSKGKRGRDFFDIGLDHSFVVKIDHDEFVIENLTISFDPIKKQKKKLHEKIQL